ncbi:MAG TPA: PDZ domain-containing protein [Terrimesophilobacter sp.]|nr:PDZ domain-containing protein [Terrimesophilobacter sp.]
MALFVDDSPAQQPPRRSGGAVVGTWALVLAAVLLFVLALLPTPYVIQVPGPVYDTLGEVTIRAEQVPLIEIPEERTYATEGSLNLLTVGTIGSPTRSVNWFELVLAWLDPSKAVLPLDYVYPPGYSVEESNEDNRILMENSQQDAVAAALRSLGYDFGFTVAVHSLIEDSPAEGALRPGDVLVSANGAPVSGLAGLRDAIAEHGAGSPMPFVVERDGESLTVTVTPELRELQNEDGTSSERAAIGVYLSISYDFPVEVNIQLENVGGPSGGQIFALGIIDKLTPGSLTGGEDVAGTGTIDGTGDVGAIGGIVHKMFGARDAGARWFLAPVENCAEVVGHVPEGLTVIAVDTLDDSLAALGSIRAGADAASLPTCSAG